MPVSASMAETWLQVNVALARLSAPRFVTALKLFLDLKPYLDRWRAAGIVNCFFFMRKPPDIRLRFRGDTNRTRSEVELMLQSLRRGGVVEDWFTSIYEPETRKFGGPGAMSAVHSYFDADTRGWMDFNIDSAAESRIASLDHTAHLLMLVTNDLFSRVVDDAGEVWDVWCNCAARLPARRDERPSLNLSGTLTIDSMRSTLAPKDSVILNRYYASNQALADALQSEWSLGRLTVGLRVLLSYVARYCFHRWGLQADTQTEMAHTMMQILSPQRGLHGALLG